jgi:hypothetical protein
MRRTMNNQWSILSPQKMEWCKALYKRGGRFQMKRVKKKTMMISRCYRRRELGPVLPEGRRGKICSRTMLSSDSTLINP